MKNKFCPRWGSNPRPPAFHDKYFVQVVVLAYITAIVEIQSLACTVRVDVLVFVLVVHSTEHAVHRLQEERPRHVASVKAACLSA